MSLPPQFLEELRSRTSLPSLIGRRVRLARSGRDTKGCCPFHNEKTPSFYVYDDHFHCFGCGAHGDAIGFVMRAQNAGFMEAVEILAAEAGLSVPSPSPQAEAAERKRAGLGEVLAAAAAEFQRRLHQKEGAEALVYLRRRGLSDTSIERFGLGWAGEGRGSLAASLARQSITPEQLIQAGLMKEGRPPVDYFFNRVMFPIRDRRGRVISFGGRILGDGQPKYLNGPETDLFSKRRTLYGLDAAREAVRNGAPLIVVEGYMDVIALAEAGFPGAVAPLGTALTEEHLAELWKLSPAPVLCFDGDAAGRRATLRSAELALKSLTPEHTLSVMRLPEGDDPDSLIRKRGATHFGEEIKAALPIRDALFNELAAQANRATPEGQAALKSKLQELAGTISDRNLARSFRDYFNGEFFNQIVRKKKQQRPAGLARPVISQVATDERRAHVLVAILLRHPELLPSVDEAFGMLDLPPLCARLREGMDSFLAPGAASNINGMQPLDSEHLLDHLSNLGLTAEVERVFSMSPVPASALPGASIDEAAKDWWEKFNFLRLDALRQQFRDLDGHCRRNLDDASAQARLVQLREMLMRLEAGETDDEAVHSA